MTFSKVFKVFCWLCARSAVSAESVCLERDARFRLSNNSCYFTMLLSKYDDANNDDDAETTLSGSVFQILVTATWPHKLAD